MSVVPHAFRFCVTGHIYGRSPSTAPLPVRRAQAAQSAVMAHLIVYCLAQRALQLCLWGKNARTRHQRARSHERFRISILISRPFPLFSHLARAPQLRLTDSFLVSRSLFGGPIAGVLLTRDHGRYFAMIIFSGSTVMLGSLFILGARLLVDRRFLARA